jgi:hypothetical protein
MAFKFPPKYGRPSCPKCDTSMIVVDGFDMEPQDKTFECLKCAQLEKPASKPAKPSQAAE